MDLSNFYLHVRARITKPDETDLDANTGVAPVNYWLHSPISQADVSLNDTVVTGSENTYSYRANIEATLNYGREAKKSHLTSAFRYRDSANHFEETQDDASWGLKVRRELTARSREADMMGRLHTDLMHQERYMLSGVDVEIRLIPSENVFNLMFPDPFQAFKSVFTHASLSVRKVKQSPAVSLAHAKAPKKDTAKYSEKSGAENFLHSHGQPQCCAGQPFPESDTESPRHRTGGQRCVQWTRCPQPISLQAKRSEFLEFVLGLSPDPRQVTDTQL